MSEPKDKPDAFLDHLSETLAPPEGSAVKPLSVTRLIEACPRLDLHTEAGKEGLDNRLCRSRPQLLGLALSGFTDDIETGSVQLLGKAELRYMQERPFEEWQPHLSKIFEQAISCCVVPDHGDDSPPLSPEFLELAQAFQVPILTSCQEHGKVEARISRVLDEHLSPNITIHGDLVAFRGLGLLLIGKSGIGKSDCALDLVANGHQLVADDAVTLRRNPLHQIIGRGANLIKHHMDVRGVGIVNVREMFSIYSVVEEHTVDLVLYLTSWDGGFDRFREDTWLEILGIRKPMITLPVSQGRHWENLIQVAVRKFMLMHGEGYDAQASLCTRLDQILDPSGPSESSESP